MRGNFGLKSGDQLAEETRAIEAGLKVIKDLAESRAPILTGRLRSSGQITTSSGTSGTVSFRLIYARKQEERGWQKHPHGGQAHYLASAFIDGADKAMSAIADRLFEGL